MTADTDTRKLAEAATPDLAEQLIVHTMTCAVGPTDCPTCTILKEAADEITALRAKVKAGRGIYTASKTTHAHLWKRFRADGYPIISTWLDEAGKGETKSFEDLWARCVSEAASCAALVAYRESGEILKGGLIEIGAALANGRPVFFVGDVEGYSFKAHPLVTICPDIETAFRRAQEADHG